MHSPSVIHKKMVTAELERIDALEWVDPPPDDADLISEKNRVRFYELLLGANAKCIYGLCEKDGERRAAKILTGVAYQKYWDAIAKEGLAHKGFYPGDSAYSSSNER